MAVLELVGDGRESPDVVDALLDVDARPRRPQYLLADERPLVLHDCAFETLEALPTPDALLNLHQHLAALRHTARVELAKSANALAKLENITVRRRDLAARLEIAGAAAEEGDGGPEAVPWPAARALLLAATEAKAAARAGKRPRECA